MDLDPALQAWKADQVALLRGEAAELRRQAAAKDARADVIVRTWQLDSKSEPCEDVVTQG